MKFTIFHLPRSLACLLGATLVAVVVTPAVADKAAPQEVAIEVVKILPAKESGMEAKKDEKAKEPSASKARLFLTNGDKLSGLPQSVDEEQRLLFKSDSLSQIASFPLSNVLSINLDNWKQHPNAKTVARIQLQKRFRETTGDTILGELTELTPDSIKLDTWYGGVITLKRSMVESLKIISNAPGNYYGPNRLQEWTQSGNSGSWAFRSGALVSQAAGGIGRDLKLREKSQISFDASWKTSMRFKFQIYSSDIKDSTPDAYYEISLNRSYAYMRTRGKGNQGARVLGGGRWKQIAVKPEENHAHFDVFANRKTGSITIYINGQRACMLQSQNPDPVNLGTALTFVAEDKYPLEISGVTVTPWNGTTYPKPKTKIKAAPAEDDKKDEQAEDTVKPPHRIILNNGDEVPGTVGKVADGRMIIETEFTPIRVPIDRIKSLSLGDSGEEPKKYQKDIRAWFHSGGHVTLKLATFKGDKITGYSQALGDVSFDLSAFSRIDFHIYDNKANETRKNIRF
jgi:hypothetical protein